MRSIRANYIFFCYTGNHLIIDLPQCLTGFFLFCFVLKILTNCQALIEMQVLVGWVVRKIPPSPAVHLCVFNPQRTLILGYLRLTCKLTKVLR